VIITIRKYMHVCKFSVVVVLCRDSRAAVSSSLQEMLVDAQQQGRLTCGINDSGTLLAKYVPYAYCTCIA